MGGRRWAFFDHPGPVAMAHRGGASEAPENTLPAFQAAVDLGYRYLETDVHATSDGVLVAFHDDHLDRVTDRTGMISELPWSEVSQARVDGEPIPLMADLLDAWPDVRFNIDAKTDRAVEPLIEVIERCQAHERVCIGAFDNRRLRRVRRLTGGRVCTVTGPLVLGWLRVAATFRLPLGPVAAGCVQTPLSHRSVTLVEPRLLAVAHRHGLPVVVWTIDDRAEMTRLLDLGVDGIITDRPSVLKDVLVARGQWVAR